MTLKKQSSVCFLCFNEGFCGWLGRDGLWWRIVCFGLFRLACLRNLRPNCYLCPSISISTYLFISLVLLGVASPDEYCNSLQFFHYDKFHPTPLLSFHSYYYHCHCCYCSADYSWPSTSSDSHNR